MKSSNTESMGGAVAGLFPRGVCVATADSGRVCGQLHPEEEALLPRLAPARRQEFLAGRLCARRLLCQLGLGKYPILRHESGAALWPAGIVGSISHTIGLCAVALVRVGRAAAIGLDVERVDRMLNSYWKYICTPRETAWMQSLPPDQQQPCAALIFSAKESFYKCQFTLTQSFLGFQDVVIVPDLGRKRFEVRYAADAPGFFQLSGELQGRFGFHGPYVCTGMVIARPDNRSPS